MTTVAIGNTNIRGAGSANREDLENMISNADRSESPFIESIGTVKASNILHEWNTDTYGSPLAANHAEGGGFSSDSTTTRPRLGNYMSRVRKDIAVSGTTEAVDRNGVADELDYQLKKAIVEARQGLDVKYLRHSNAVGGNASVAFTTVPTNYFARSIWSYMHEDNMRWLGASVALTLDNGTTTALTGAGNVVSAAANPSAPSNYAADGSNFVRYSGTGAAASRDDYEIVIENMYLNGGRPNFAMMPSSQKRAASALFGSDTTTAERRLTAMENKVNIAVSGVITDFGVDLMMVPNYLMRTTAGYALENSTNDSVLFYDSSKLKRAQLRKLKRVSQPRDGDLIRGVVVGEETLKVDNGKYIGGFQNATS